VIAPLPLFAAVETRLAAWVMGARAVDDIVVRVVFRRLILRGWW
jgi:hypothetical protein